MSSNRAKKTFTWMGHVGLVVGSINLERLSEFFQSEDPCFGFIEHRSSEEGNGLNNVIDDSFELLSCYS